MVAYVLATDSRTEFPNAAVGAATVDIDSVEGHSGGEVALKGENQSKEDTKDRTESDHHNGEYSRMKCLRLE